MSKHNGKSIKLYLADGIPQGLITAEIMNWTGHVVSVLRTNLVALAKRTEASSSGIYFLIGESSDTAFETEVYIGESDNVSNRIIQHSRDKNKNFWVKACVVTSKDLNVTKSHIRYLESRIITIAQQAKRAKIHNNTAPKPPSLPEADVADMENFISEIQLIMPILGHDFLRDKPQITQKLSNPSNIDNSNEHPTFEINSSKFSLKAYAQEINGDFIVLKVSECQPNWLNPTYNSYEPLYKKLFDQEIIKVDKQKNIGVFQEDTIFNSPSAASAIIFARTSNGRKSWKVKGTSKTYADWQDEQLAKIEQEI